MVTAILLISVIPALNIIWIIASTGANNLSNDSRAFVGPIDQILSGTYNWTGFFRDSTYGAHFLPVLLLFHLVSAQLFHWNVYAEMFIGVLICLPRVYFWFQVLRTEENSLTSWFLLPAICALVFSDSQISLFINPDAGIPIGLTLLAQSMGIWALIRLKKAPLVRLLLMCFAGLLASFSWGSGVSVWLSFLFTMIVFSYRMWWHYIIWAAAAGLSLMPYAYNLAYSRLVQSGAAYPGTTFVGLFKWKFILDSLGRPFCNDIGYNFEYIRHALTIGWSALILCAIGLTLHLFSRSKFLRLYARAPAILIAYGVVSLWQISTARVLHAPWYTALAIPLWIGLVALALKMVQSREFKNGAVQALSIIWAGLTIIFAMALYFYSNLTYEDKSTYMMARSPASASALRNYLSGPTYSENYLFQWQLGNFDYVGELARPLERHNLSVFAPHQTWTLQGDWLLDNVAALHWQPNATLFWSKNKGREGRLPWYHYRHLNLCLLGSSAVEWTIKIPENTNEAILHSAVAVQNLSQKHHQIDSNSQSERSNSSNIGHFCMSVRKQQRSNEVVPIYDQLVLEEDYQWRDVSFPLTRYKGQSITLVLAAKSKRPDLITAFRYPYIDLKLAPPETWMKHPIIPSNTDLSPDFPKRTRRDLVFSAIDTVHWQIKGLDQANELSPGTWRLDKKITSSLSYLPEFMAPLSPYSHFAISLSASKNITPRAVTVNMTLQHQKEKVSFVLPLLSDGNMHEYTYNLRLLELEPDSVLKGLTVSPIINGISNGTGLITIRDMRLIRR